MRQLSIKIKMAMAVFVLVAALLGLTGVFAFQYFKENLRDTISRQQFTLVSALAEEIDGKIRATQNHLQAMARMVSPEVLADPARAEAFLHSQEDNQELFDNGLFLFGVDDSTLAAVQKVPNHCVDICPLQLLAHEVVQSRKPQISEPIFSSEEQQRPVILFTSPVFDREGEIAAVLGGSLELSGDNFIGRLSEVRLGKAGYLYLYDQRRTIIAHPNRSRVLQRDVPVGVNRLFDAALEGFEGTGETTTSWGLQALSSFKRLQATGWILAANYPLAEALAPIEVARRNFLLGSMVMLLISFLAVWLLMRHLTAPLLQLTDQVRLVKDSGATPVSLGIRVEDEIGVLGRAFNEMLEQLAKKRRALGEQLHFLQVLINAIPNPIFFKDAEGRYLGCNRAFEDYLGISRQDLIGKSVYDIAPPHLAEIYHQADAELFTRGINQTQVYESSVIYADGTPHEVIFYKATFPTSEGTLGGLVGAILDITERKRAEQALAVQKHFSDQLLQNAAAAAFVIDAEHRVIVWNRACEELTGVRAEEVIGTDEHWRAFYDYRRPCLADFAFSRNLDDLAGAYEEYRRSDLIPEGLVAEGWLVLNGRRRYIVFNAAPVFSEEGRICAAIETLEDFTERKQAEESLARSLSELRQTAEQLRKLYLAVEQSPNSVVITDPTGTIEYVNERFCEVSGYSREEALGQNTRIFKSGNVPDGYYRTLWQTITAGQQWRGEFHNRRRSGEDLWESTLISPLKNSEGTITHFVALKEDISERKIAEKRQYLVAQVLEVLSLPSDRADKVRIILHLIKDFTGIEMVAIRLRGENGSVCSEVFSLGEAQAEGGIRGDLESLCGKVLLGATDLFPGSTAQGSFFTNRAADLDQGANLCSRDHCFRQGLQSLAFIPLHSADRIIGLLQLGDRREGKLPAQLIEFLEKIASSIGIALEHRQTEERLLEKEKSLSFLTHFDPLTRLPNRTLLQDRLQHAMDKARRSGKKVALLVLDLDRFSTINDSLGHELGDQFLCLAAQKLGETIREADTLARFGGDEFIIVLEEVEESKEIATVGEKILGHLCQGLVLADHCLYLTASIGISFYPTDADEVESLLKFAEIAMHRAKELGGNNLQFFRPEMNARRRELLLLEGGLRQALKQEEFVLHYQPQVDLASGRVVGVEALLRWHHPEQGMVPPGEFIPLAEDTGLIIPIGEWVLRTACNQARHWQESGLSPFRVGVNISGRQFKQAEFVALVERVLNETGLDPRWLELEITESVVMDNVEETISTLTALKRLGVRLALDDFGTGYSSLAYLSRFPIDQVKIDRSFVKDIVSDPNSATIATAIIALAHRMRLKVVAEGVETEAQLAYLRKHDCDEMQGYFFSRPLPPEGFAEMLRTGKSLPPTPMAGPEEARTLLIVDDEPNILKALRRVFDDEGYRILTVASAAEGLELLAKNQVQVILSDQRMPQMSGTEFLGRVKALHPDTVRIVLSGYADLDTVTRSVNEGALYKFLGKPWEDDQLREHVRDAFQYYEAIVRPRHANAQ